MRIGKKFIHHACLLGALVAPAVYLFGSMFMGLAGAHGEQLWAQEAGQTEYWVEYEGEQYKYIDFSEYYFYVEVQEYSTGNLTLSYFNERLYINVFDWTNATVYGNIQYDSAQLANYGYTYWAYTKGLNINAYIPEESTFDNELNEKVCFTVWQDDADSEVVSYWEVFIDEEGYSIEYWDMSYSDLEMAYEGTGPNLFDILVSDSIQLFGDGKGYGAMIFPETWVIDHYINYNWHSETYNQNYTDGVFGNFFPRGNFLEKWGNDAISDNPVGFAPFGQLFRYLDDNMLHFGLNGNQAGLMAYGYMYWIGHVFIADLALCCLVFIPKLLRKIVDKVGGNDD